jgi:hypothetical protein
MLLLTVEGPEVPFSRGLFGLVALRCNAEECVFSLSTQAQDHVWDLVEQRTRRAHNSSSVLLKIIFHEPPRGGAKLYYYYVTRR